jgi:hypothetical protein
MTPDDVDVHVDSVKMSAVDPGAAMTHGRTFGRMAGPGW